MRDAPPAGESVTGLAPPADAHVSFIGRLRTPWSERADCPRQGTFEGPECQVEVFGPWRPAIEGLERFGEIELLYWMDRARRDLLIQHPAHLDAPRGTFSLRSPARPNPIATARVRLIRIEESVLHVRGLDCVDGTPLLDIKPDRCAFLRPD